MWVDSVRRNCWNTELDLTLGKRKSCLASCVASCMYLLLAVSSVTASQVFTLSHNAKDNQPSGTYCFSYVTF